LPKTSLSGVHNARRVGAQPPTDVRWVPTPATSYGVATPAPEHLRRAPKAEFKLDQIQEAVAALPEGVQVPCRASPCQAGRLGQAQRGQLAASKQIRHVASELSQEGTDKCSAIPKGNGGRRHVSQDGQHWESPKLGWSSRLCTDKDSNHRGLMRWRNIKDLQVASLQMASGAKRTCKSLQCA
jgi:hypothetical protein